MATDSVVIEFTGDASGLKPLADALKALGQLTDEQIKAFNDATKAAENFGQKSAKATKETEKSAEELNKSFKEFQEGIIAGATEEFGKQMKTVGLEATKTAETTKRLTTQLRDLKNQLGNLKEGSAEFKKIAIEAARLEDKIGDISKEVRILASDSLALDTMTGIARGIAGGFALAQGAAALFGKENEDVQKALLKVNAAMAILQGLQEVSLVLRKEEVVRVGLAAAAQKAYAFVVNTSTGAVRAFNAAIATIGIGAIIAGIVLLITYWDDLKAAITGATDANEDWKESNKARADYLDKLDAQAQKELENARIAREAAEGGIADIKRQIKFAQDLGKSEDDLFILKKLLRDKELQELRIQEQSIKDLRGIGTDDRIAALNKISILIKDKEAEIYTATKRSIGALNELAETPFKNKFKFEIDETAGQGDLGTSKGEKAQQGILSNFDLLNQKISEKQDEQRQKEIDAEKEKQEAIRDNALSIAQETFDTIFAITSERRNQEYEAELAALNKEKEAKLANKKLTDGQRAAIEAQYRKKEAKIKEEQFKKDKAAAIVQALINGALAIATTIAKLGAPPSPAGIAGLAAVAASTALSVASIAAQPIPKFAKGTKDAEGGLAIVGERGKEIIAHDGSFQLVGKGLVNLPKHAKVIPHPESMKILDGHVDTDRILSDYNINTTSSTNIDYHKLATELGKELAKHPKTTINVDENGLRVFIQSENHRVERLEKRYASK